MNFVQGAGTAIGELPPYFMARTSRLSGQIDEEEQEIEDLLEGRGKSELVIIVIGPLINFMLLVFIFKNRIYHCHFC